MVGATISHGATLPDLYEILAEYATLQQLQEGLSGRVASQQFLNGVAKLEGNPALGSLTRYAGFDWLVVHRDADAGLTYLALKDIYCKTRFAKTADVSNVSYENSELRDALSDFEENELLARVGAAALARELDCSLTESYAFIPSAERIRTFSLFAGGQTSGNAVACCNGVPSGWWTSSVEYVGSEPVAYFVGAVGSLGSGKNGSLLFDDVSVGFRPFIRMKMR